MTEKNSSIISFTKIKRALLLSVTLLSMVTAFIYPVQVSANPERGVLVGKSSSDSLLTSREDTRSNSATSPSLPSVVKIVYFKNADDFAKTYDQADTVNNIIRQQAFNLYKQGAWLKLESLFKQYQLNKSGTTIWPPASGGYNIVDSVSIKVGQKFDRYGNAAGYSGTGVPNLTGSFTSPMPGGVSYKFSQRALNLPENAYDFYYVIEVLKNLPFKSQTATIIPWFGEQGNGKQSLWFIPKNPNSPQGYSYTLTELAQLGFIKITIKKSPSGRYPALVNTVIQK